jgi:hypothetical protein
MNFNTSKFITVRQRIRAEAKETALIGEDAHAHL